MRFTEVKPGKTSYMKMIDNGERNNNGLQKDMSSSLHDVDLRREQLMNEVWYTV